MLRRIPAQQWYEWQASVQLDPFLEDRSDLHLAMLVATHYNARYGTREKPNPFRAAQFMPQYGPSEFVAESPKPKMDWRMMKEIGKMYAGAFSPDYKDEKQPRVKRGR